MSEIGKVLYGHDSDSYAFRDRNDLPRCSNCGSLLQKWEQDLSGLKLRKRNLDVSYTYDGVLVVSKRFRDFIDGKGFVGGEFQQLPNDSDYCSLMCDARVAFDYEKRQTRFEDRCDECGCYDSVAGATPAFLKNPEKIACNSLSRTDLEFGRGDEKHPLIVCGAEVVRAISSQNFRGIDFAEIRD